jgi:hypothetical protein
VLALGSWCNEVRSGDVLDEKDVLRRRDVLFAQNRGATQSNF